MLLPEMPPAPPVCTTDPVCGESERGTSSYRQRELQPRLPTSAVIGSAYMGPFQLSAKVSSLLHRALCVDKDRGAEDIREWAKMKGRERRKGAPSRIPGVLKVSLADFASLDREVRQTSQTLLEQTVQWEAMLDCFSMLVRYVRTLGEFIVRGVPPWVICHGALAIRKIFLSPSPPSRTTTHASHSNH